MKFTEKNSGPTLTVTCLLLPGVSVNGSRGCIPRCFCLRLISIFSRYRLFCQRGPTLQSWKLSLKRFSFIFCFVAYIVHVFLLLWTLCLLTVHAFLFDNSLLQYASIKNNDGSFMSPEDFVTQFLYAHTDIRLSEGATTLLAGVVDQKKDGFVFCLGCRHRASPLHWIRHLPSYVSKKVWLASHCIIPISYLVIQKTLLSKETHFGLNILQTRH